MNIKYLFKRHNKIKAEVRFERNYDNSIKVEICIMPNDKLPDKFIFSNLKDYPENPNFYIKSGQVCRIVKILEDGDRAKAWAEKQIKYLQKAFQQWSKGNCPKSFTAVLN